MTKLRTHLRTLDGASAALAWSGARAVPVDRSSDAGGLGVGFNGGELLFLAIAACYCNDLYREAAREGVPVQGVSLEVEGEFGGDPVVAMDVRLHVDVTSTAPEEDVRRLVEHTDRVAEIPNSLRLGTQVALGSVRIRAG